MFDTYHRYKSAALRGGCDAMQAHHIALGRCYDDYCGGKKVSGSQSAGAEVSSATSMKGKD